VTVVEAATIRFGLFHGCQKGGGNCPAFGWHSWRDTGVSAGRFGSERGRRQPERGTNPSCQSSGMAGPRLEPDPAAKECLSPPESRMQPEMPEQVGDGAAPASSGAAGAGSGGQAPACTLASRGGSFPGTSRGFAFSVLPFFGKRDLNHLPYPVRKRDFPTRARGRRAWHTLSMEELAAGGWGGPDAGGSQRRAVPSAREVLLPRCRLREGVASSPALVNYSTVSAHPHLLLISSS